MTAAQQLVDMRFLRTLVPLGELDHAQMQRLMGHYSVDLVEAGTTLFSIGENDPYTYYVLSGQVLLHFRSGSEREVKAQTTQARYQLVPERPRTATATAQTTCSILKIEKEVLDELVRWGERKAIGCRIIFVPRSF
jgi:CRP-like cAMP-binding protein